MSQTSLLLKKISEFRTPKLLDVGCGCGAFTVELSPYCNEIVAVDAFKRLIHRCRNENHRDNITYLCSDARALCLANESFDTVVERASLHHIEGWERAASEMIRVAKRFVMIEEPITDLRSEGKRNALRAHRFFTELQREVGFPHFDFIDPEQLVEPFKRRGMTIQTGYIRSDEPESFEEFFEPFPYFVEKSQRQEYWYERFNQFRTELRDVPISKSDVIFIMATKER